MPKKYALILKAEEEKQEFEREKQKLGLAALAKKLGVAKPKVSPK